MEMNFRCIKTKELAKNFLKHPKVHEKTVNKAIFYIFTLRRKQQQISPKMISSIIDIQSGANYGNDFNPMVEICMVLSDTKEHSTDHKHQTQTSKTQAENGNWKISEK